MSYIDPTTLARIKSQITTKEAQLTAANNALISALENSEVQTYQLDTGEGKQTVTRRKPKDISSEITRLESELRRLYNQASGTGIVSLGFRRARS